MFDSSSDEEQNDFVINSDPYLSNGRQNIHITNEIIKYQVIDEQLIKEISEEKLIKKIKTLKPLILLESNSEEEQKEQQIKSIQKKQIRYFEFNIYLFCEQCRHHGHRHCSNYYKNYCKYCLSEDHLTQQCDNIVEFNQCVLTKIESNNKDVRCFKCQQYGHINCNK